MTITANNNVQEPCFATADIDFAGLAAGATVAVNLPSGGEVIGGGIVILAPFSGGSFTVGDGEDQARYTGAVDATRAGFTPLAVKGIRAANQAQRQLTLTFAGAPPIAGTARLGVLYVQEGVAEFNLPLKVI